MTHVDSVASTTELASIIATARAAWPGVDLDVDAFASHLAGLVAADGDASIPRLQTSDLYLACACARGDAAALAAFDAAFMRPLPAILAGAGHDPATADETTQRLRERLLIAAPGARPRIAEYAGRGSLAGFVRVAAFRLAANHVRDARAAGGQEVLAGATADAELEIVRRLYQGAFDQAFRDAFRALAPEERLVLRLHFAEGLTREQVAVALATSRATIGRRLLAARRRVKEEMLAILRVRLKGSSAEIESLLEAVQSKLDVTLGALITDEPARGSST